MPFVMAACFRHPMQFLRAVSKLVRGCFVAPKGGEPVLPTTVIHPPSSTKLDLNTPSGEPSRENSTSSQHLHPATPSTSPTVVSPSENGNDAPSLAAPSGRNSRPPTSIQASTLNTRDEVERRSESSPGSVAFSLAEGNPASGFTDSDVPIDLAYHLVSNLASLSTPLVQIRPPDTPISELSGNVQKVSIKAWADTVQGSEGSGRALNVDNKPTLRAQLSEVQYEPWKDFKYFNANNDLRRLITPKSILRQMSLDGIDMTEKAAAVISERAHKLFATLVYARLSHHIPQFLGEGIDDTDLPFTRLSSSDERRKFFLCSKKKQDEPIKCMATWDHGDILEFAKTQWCMLAPVFEFTEKVEHYEFEHHCILPWTEDHECSSSGHKGGAVSGGFGSVWKIKIHPAHQQVVQEARRGLSKAPSLPTNELECPYPCAALKRLHVTNEESFWSEVAMLKEFKNHPHAHLVKLLATFRWKDKYYLIFPFAESNLREYWKATPLPAFSYDNLFWVLQQCRAITSGLHVVHEQRYTHAPSSNSTHDEQSRYGRHGDLKAENILWFPEEGTEFGRLVIADFGLTDFHKRSTRSDIPADHITGSPSYEPPELRLHSNISRAYDIWTLGCLYLELMTWLVCGSDVLERFPDARKEEIPSEPNVIDDTFFTITGDGSPGASTKHAIVRSIVSTWIQDLHEMPRCSAFVHDFLDLISKQMLLVDPGARIKIGHLNREIQYMIVKAKDPSYLIQGAPYPPRDQLHPPPSSLTALKLNRSTFPGTSDGTPLPRKGSSD